MPIDWTPILATAVGFLLSELAHYIRERRDEKEEDEVAEFLISKEMDENRGSLNNYWSQVSTSRDNWRYDGDFLYSELALAITEIPFPQLDWSAWESNLERIPRCFSRHEIEDKWRLKKAAARLQDWYTHLIALRERKFAAQQDAPSTHLDKRPISELQKTGKVDKIQRSMGDIAENFKRGIESLDEIDSLEVFCARSEISSEQE